MVELFLQRRSVCPTEWTNPQRTNRTRSRPHHWLVLCQWLQITCLRPHPASVHSQLESDLHHAVQRTIPAAVSTVVSRVHFGQCVGGYFNRRMNARSRAEKLTDLLEGEFAFGEMISRKFCRYWSADLIKEQVTQAAQALVSSEVSLSLYDKLHNTFLSLAHNYITLTVHKMNEHFNLEVLLSNYHGNEETTNKEAVLELFQELVLDFPDPTMSELSLLKHTFDERRSTRHCYPSTFPSFHRVWQGFNKQLELAISQLHAEGLLDEGNDAMKTHTSSLEERAVARLEERLRHLEKETRSDHSPLIAARALDKYPSLWQHYLTDFIQQRLHLTPGPAGDGRSDAKAVGDMERSFVSAWLDGLNQIQPVSRRPVVLQVLSRLRLRVLSQLISSLRPLAAIHTSITMAADDITTSLPSAAGHVEAQLFRHLVSSLFNCLLVIRDCCKKYPLPSHGSSHLLNWFRAFRNSLTLLPSLRYSLALSPVLRGRLDVLAIVSALLGAVNPTNYCHRAALNLFSALCDVLSASEPGRLLLPVAVQESHRAVLFSFAPPPRDDEDKGSEEVGHFVESSWRHVVERLLEHYFPSVPSSVSFSMSYNTRDVLWMLKALNQQPATSSLPASAISEPGVSLSNSLPLSDVLPASVKNVCMAQYWLEQLLQPAHAGDRHHLTEASKQTRLWIGKELASYSQEETFCESFVPSFYLQSYILRYQPGLRSLVIGRLQQSLAVLYFHCCLDKLRLLLSITELPHVLGLIQAHDLAISASDDVGEKCVLQLERQALVQVFLHQFATQIALQASRRGTLRETLRPELISAINALMLDSKTGGGVGGGHSHVLLSLLCLQLHSSRCLVRLLHARDVNVLGCFEPWLKPFLIDLSRPSDLQTHLLPFTLESATETSLGGLYQSVRRRMKIIARQAHSFEAE